MNQDYCLTSNSKCKEKQKLCLKFKYEIRMQLQNTRETKRKELTQEIMRKNNK